MPLVPCPQGYVRNPDTRRCRKDGVPRDAAGHIVRQLVPCKQGYERNPATRRCKKTRLPRFPPPNPIRNAQDRQAARQRARRWAGVGDDFDDIDNDENVGEGVNRNNDVMRKAVIDGISLRQNAENLPRQRKNPPANPEVMQAARQRATDFARISMKQRAKRAAERRREIEDFLRDDDDDDDVLEVEDFFDALDRNNVNDPNNNPPARPARVRLPQNPQQRAADRAQNLAAARKRAMNWANQALPPIPTQVQEQDPSLVRGPPNPAALQAARQAARRNPNQLNPRIPQQQTPQQVANARKRAQMWAQQNQPERPGYEINPVNGRYRKKCRPGYFRNVTGRCKKIAR